MMHLARPGCITFNIDNMIISKLVDFSTNLPIVGANVYVAGQPDKGVATNDLGAFSLNALPSDTIIVSHLNFGKQEFRPDQVTPVIYLDPVVEQLDEVVIVGNSKTNWLKWIGYTAAALAVIKIVTNNKPTRGLAKPSVLDITL